MVFMHLRYPALQILYKKAEWGRTEQGLMVLVNPVQWIRFAGSEYSTDDKSEIKFLKESSDFKNGVMVDKAEFTAKVDHAKKARELGAKLAALTPEQLEKVATEADKIKEK